MRTAKYEWWNFIPFNLITQFQKGPNIYFLVISIMQTIELISISNGKSAMAFPLVLVVAISMLKDGYEDYKRHVNDRNENDSMVDTYVHASKNW